MAEVVNITVDWEAENAMGNMASVNSSDSLLLAQPHLVKIQTTAGVYIEHPV